MACVYFLSGPVDGEVKVGRLTSGLRELDRIETEEPLRCERHLHALLEPWRIPGTREWFRVSAERLATAIAAGRAWTDNDLPKTLQFARSQERRATAASWSRTHLYVTCTTSRVASKPRSTR